MKALDEYKKKPAATAAKEMSFNYDGKTGTAYAQAPSEDKTTYHTCKFEIVDPKGAKNDKSIKVTMLKKGAEPKPQPPAAKPSVCSINPHL
jgi:hypothetical protein